MIRFTGTVEGEEVLRRGFNRVADTISDFRDVWDDVETVFHEIETEQFQSGGAKGASGKWQELSSKYEALKPTDALIAGPLHLSFDLYKSLTRKTEHTVSIKDKTEAAFGTSLKYAKYHALGGRRLPQRKPIDPSDSQKRKLSKGIQKGLLRLVRQQSAFDVEGDF